MDVLQQYGKQTDEMSVLLCNTTLETLSEYADWIDISFMVSPMTLNTFSGVRGERAFVFRGADQQGHAIGEQGASDPFPPNQYPSKRSIIDP